MILRPALLFTYPCSVCIVLMMSFSYLYIVSTPDCIQVKLIATVLYVAVQMCILSVLIMKLVLQCSRLCVLIAGCSNILLLRT